MNPTIRLRNMPTQAKEPLRTEQPDRVTMHVCGPTVYKYTHIGNAQPAMVFDVLSQLLRHDNSEVVYARNSNDVDDKINAVAAAGVPIGAISKRYIAAYHEDMQALGGQTPDLEPCVTRHISDIIEFIQELIKRGQAFEAQRHVLCHLSSYPEYGQLLAEREKARRERNFAKADALGDHLDAAGFVIENTPSGPIVQPKAMEYP